MAECKYKPAMNQTVLDLMNEGASFNEVASKLGVSVRRFAEWRTGKCKSIPQSFIDACNQGVDLAQAWWEKLGREAVTCDKPINVPIWIFNMKNRFGWRDSRQLDIKTQAGAGGGEANTKKLMDSIEQMLKDRNKTIRDGSNN